MNILWVYFGVIFLITAAIISTYLGEQVQYDQEIKRIEVIEQKMKHRDEEIKMIRSKTQPCHQKNLNDPRSCYFKSEHKCVWNELAERCDKI